MAATIRDVAERAGVSVSTVSRVFNGYRFVGERTRERVLDAMAALDYRPDMVARSMRTGKTRAVGLVVDDFTNPLFSQHATHAEALLRANGYSLMIANSERSPEHEAAVVETMRQRRVDALLIALVDEGAPSSRSCLEGFGAVVLLDRELPGATADAVLPDHAQGLREAIDHLLALGHERIALLAGPQGQRGSRIRLETFREHLGARGLLDPALVRVVGEPDVTGSTEVRELLALADPPTALIAGTNRIFVGIATELRQLGVAVPGELSLIACDDVDVTRLYEPPIDVIERDVVEQGRASAELVLARLKDPDGPPQTRTVPTAFRRRASTAAAPRRVRSPA